MGVMLCSRSGCHNVMCDTYIEGIGYICQSCQEEFKTFAQLVTTEGDIKRLLKKFMDTEAGDYSPKHITVDEFFKSHTNTD